MRRDPSIMNYILRRRIMRIK